MSGPRRNPAHDEQQGYKLPPVFDKLLGRNQPPEPTPRPDPTKPPGKAPDPNDIEKTQVYELYLMGWKASEIEKETGIDAKKIINWTFKDRWGERKEYYDALKSKKNPEAGQPIVKAVITANRDERRREFLEHTGVMAAVDAKHWSEMTPDERLAAAPSMVPLNKMHRDNLDLNGDADSGHGKGSLVNLTFLTNADKPGMVRVINQSTEVQRIEDTK